MEYFDDEFDGILFPTEILKSITNPLEEKVINELMLLTNCNRFYSRQAMTEFLKRIFLQFNVPLHSFTDNYFNKQIIFEVQTEDSILPISISTLTNWIGITQKLPGEFDYTGTTEDYLKDQYHHVPKVFSNQLRQHLHVLTKKTINDCETVALFFTDMIEDVHFINPVFHNKRQYSRDQYDFICFEKNKAVMFNPLKDLSSSTIRRIELIIGERKLDSINDFVEASKEDKLEEIIRIAFGIKNGFINPRGNLFDFNKSVDPYFFFSLSPIMPVFLKSKTFLDIYHYYEMYEWMDLLPNHQNKY
jgi:hypothetical protein